MTVGYSLQILLLSFALSPKGFVRWSFDFFNFIIGRTHIFTMADFAPPEFPIRTDTYQTAKNCAVVLYTKGHTLENLVTHPESNSLTIEADIDGTHAIKAWQFYSTVDPSSARVSPGRATTEIVLAKSPAATWPRVEAEEAQTAVLYEKWNKAPVAKEEEEKPDGLDGLLQKIYKDAPEDTRRAMMKSFTESKGTVLSTDWKDIGGRFVEPQPPKD
jgi:suppressor of G2 allele of SKP1